MIRRADHPSDKSMPTLEYLFEQKQLTIEDVAETASMPADRVEAIILGRWTPSPQERQKVAAALEIPVEEITWGHTMDPRNVRYRRFQLDVDSDT